MDAYERYRRRVHRPAKNKVWLLEGAGMRNFRLVEEGPPVPGPGEVLMRVDAVSVCYSDVKLVEAGSAHPRVRVPLEERPTVPGHEVSMTVVEAGKGVEADFPLGKRFIIQADIFLGGEMDTFGYIQRGGMGLYVVVKNSAVRGDHGCYLLPVREESGFSEAALVEPWACVEAAYHIEQGAGFGPSSVVFLHPALAELDEEVRRAGAGDVSGTFQPGRTDRILLPADAAAAGAYRDVEAEVPPGAVVGLVDTGGESFPAVDAGAIHYRNLRLVAGTTRDIVPRMCAPVRKGLKPGGRVLFVGAGGPMGQMHVQRACGLRGVNAPRLAAVTDVSAERLRVIGERFETADPAGRFGTFDASVPAAVLRERLLAFSGGGFDDIVLLAPVPALVEEAQRLARSGCLVNIFAGLPAGSSFRYDVRTAAAKSVSFVGSSGSSLDDLRRALSLVESGVIDADRIVRAVGGLEAIGDGVAAARRGAYAGKVVIYPHLQGLPLLSLEELSARCPGVGAAMNGGYWNRRAERVLFNSFLHGEHEAGGDGDG